MEIWKYYLPTDGRTDGRTDRQTWVGARDACASKKSFCKRYDFIGFGWLKFQLKWTYLFPKCPYIWSSGLDRFGWGLDVWSVGIRALAGLPLQEEYLWLLWMGDDKENYDVKTKRQFWNKPKTSENLLRWVWERGPAMAFSPGVTLASLSTSWRAPLSCLRTDIRSLRNIALRIYKGPMN